MDYSVLHDAEINMKVCAILGLGLSGHARIIRQGDASILLDDNETLVDYCNSPADAWPIIHQHGISIAFDKDEDEWLAWGDFAFDQAGWDMKKEPEISCAHINPLRAAMTVFLLLQESANVQANPARPDIR